MAAQPQPQPQPKPPQPRSLLTLQAQVAAGAFAERQLRGIIHQKNQEEMQMLAKLLDCTKEVQANLAKNPQRPRAAQMKNLVCICHSVCPSETEEWVGCFRTVQKRRKQQAQALAAGSPLPQSDGQPSTNCEALKRRLELCTQYASTRLLHAAVLPKDRAS